MATTKDIVTLLDYLHGTPNFELVFSQVFGRIVKGRGHGLMILEGPSEIANKSFFLKMVKVVQKGVPPLAKTYFTDDMRRLLAEVDMNHYNCVDIKEDCPIGASNLYVVPLYLTLPLSLASASQKRGLKKGYKTVVLCDDLQEFLRHNNAEQVLFLKQVAGLTSDYKGLTFLGAYTLGRNGEGLKNTALSDYVLPLG